MKTTESNEVIESNDTSGEVLNYENPVVEIGITKNNPEGTGEFNLEEFETDYSYEIYPDEDTTPNGKDVYYETGKFDPLPNILLYDDDGGAQVYNQYDFKYLYYYHFIIYLTLLLKVFLFHQYQIVIF